MTYIVFTFKEFDCHQDDTWARAPFSKRVNLKQKEKEIGSSIDSRMVDAAWMQSTGTPSDDRPTKQTYEISRVLN